MAKLRQFESETRRLVDLVGELRAATRDGGGDFGRMIELADEIGESADSLAETFARVDEIFERNLLRRPARRSESEGAGRDLMEALTPARRGAERSMGADIERLTRDELYARARAAGISG